MKSAPLPSVKTDIHDLASALLFIQKQEAIIAAQTQAIQARDHDIRYKSAKIEVLTFELARLKRLKFSAKTEALNLFQRSLFDEALIEDIEAIETELKALAADTPSDTPPKAAPRNTPKRQPLPEHLPRIEHRYEPASCACGACGGALKKIGEEVSEQLDCKPLEFFVHRHIRSKYSCPTCETLHVEALPAQIIDKGQPAPGLLAHVLVSKFQDHLPLYRQEQQYQERSGVSIPRNTLAGWVGACGVALQPLVERMQEHLLQHRMLHADETPVGVLKPGHPKTHRAYMWAYRTGVHAPIQAVVFDFQMSRAGAHPQKFLQGFKGALMVDDYAGYKALFADQVVKELACMAHVRRKFFELHAANKSEIAQEALLKIASLYAIEEHTKTFDAEQRKSYRDTHAKPILEALYHWLKERRCGVPNSSAIAKAIDYALKRWSAILRYLEEGHYPIDNNPCENSIRPIALGRKNWLFLGTEQSGKRSAAVMSLIASARLNGLNPYEYLKDVLTRLPSLPYSCLDDLLPYHWTHSTPS